MTTWSTRSDAAPWYDGPTVLDALESAQAGGWAAQHGVEQGSGARLPVQWVLRQPGGGPQLRRHGQRRAVPRRATRSSCCPQGHATTIRAIETADGPLQRAEVGLSVSLRLADHLDVSRGDLIAAAEGAPEVTDTFEATVCWFQDRPLAAGDRLRIKHTTRVTPVVVESVDGHLRRQRAPRRRRRPSSGRTTSASCTLRTATPLAVDPYEADRITGSFVLIDDLTFATIAAGMVGPPRLHD